jgi:hypothetical protein
VIKPCFSEQLVVSLLIEKELVVATQRRVDLTVTIQIRRVVPTTMAVVQEQDHALANVDEYTDIPAAPVCLSVVFDVVNLP